MQRFHLQPTRRRFVYSGRLVSIKRVDVLIAAFAAVADFIPNWDLVIAGDGPLAADLKKQVPEHLSHRVIWTGFLQMDALWTCYLSCDVLVHPSEQEPWALVINEAAASGLGIIATYITGAANELVVQDLNGLLVSPGSVSELAEALCHAAQPGVADRWGSQSREILERWARLADPVAGARKLVRHFSAIADTTATMSRPVSIADGRAEEARSGKHAKATRVCVLQPVLPKYRNEFFELLAKLGNLDLTLICDTKGKGSLQSVVPMGGFRVVSAKSIRLGPFTLQWKALGVIAGRKFDVVIAGWNLRLLELLPAILICRLFGRPIVLWGHGYSRRERRIIRFFRNLVGSMASGVIVYSQSTREDLIKEGMRGDRVFVAQNAQSVREVDEAIDHWTQEPSRMEAWRAQHGVRDQGLIVFISRLEPDKKPEMLIDALEHILRHGHSAKLALIGGGSMLAALKSEAAARGLAQHIVFTGPLYQEREIAPWCLSACCMAYPEAIGLSLLHAFAYGLPVVTNDDIPSHNPEIAAFKPGVNGITFSRGDPESLARSIMEFLEPPSGRRWSRAGVRQTIDQAGGFNLATMVDGFLQTVKTTTRRDNSE